MSPDAVPSLAPGSGPVIALLGAESTGKTALATSIAETLSGEAAAHGRRVVVVGEYLREFCDVRRRTPQRHEQVEIAAEQWRRIAQAAADGSVVLADTTPLMIAVYSEQVFGDRSLYATALQWQRLCTLTLLTGLDLPWQADGLQRDGPHVRVPVDALIRRALLEAGLSFPVVYGEGAARRDAALAPVRAALARLGALAGNSPPTGLIEASLQDAPPAPAAGRVRLRCRDCLQPDCEHQLFAGLAREGTSALEAAPGPSS
jgi:nicotinamide riboside kinase